MMCLLDDLPPMACYDPTEDDDDTGEWSAPTFDGDAQEGE